MTFIIHNSFEFILICRDNAGHDYGPDSPLLVDQIRNVDDQLAFLLDNLEQQGILGCLDIVVLSDHGMAPTPPGEKCLILNDYVPNIANDARIYEGVFPTIRPNNDTEGRCISFE